MPESVLASAGNPGVPVLGRRSVGWALASLSLAALLSSLGASIANVGLPTLARAFGAPFQAVQWVVLGYLLGITALIVGVGRLGDLYGRRRLLLGGLGLFTIASALAAAAPTLGLLIVARTAQGLGAATMMSLTMAFVGDTVPKARVGRAMGLIGTTSAIGTALGPSAGGLLIASLGWPAMFLVNVPLGIVALVLARRHLPADRPRGDRMRPPFDVAGMTLLAATLAGYALAMTIGRGHFGLLNALLLAGAVTIGAIFVLVERRRRHPLIELATLVGDRRSGGFVTSGLVATVMMATLIVGPFYLSRGLGLETAAVGLVTAIGPFVAALTGVPAGRAVDRFGSARTTVAGLLGIGTGVGLLVLLPGSLGVAGYLGPIVLATSGYALFQVANNTAVMGDVEADRRGVVAGLLSLSRNLGLVTGAAAMGAVFSLASGVADVSRADPEAVDRGMRITFAVAAGLIAVALAIAARALSGARQRLARGGSADEPAAAWATRPGSSTTTAS